MSASETHYRILIIDDNASIHEDFHKILDGGGTVAQTLESAEATLFGVEAVSQRNSFAINSAFQGRKGLELAQQALAEGQPYALAFVDLRMPPGWDGVETVSHLWQEDPTLQVVICTAYSDYSWDEIRRILGESDNLVILKKPFDNVEVLQLTHALTRKWLLARQARGQRDELDRLVNERTRALRESNEQLQKEIADRLKLEHQLVQAQKMETVGRLAGGVAHDFNNMLQAILGNTSMALEHLRGDSAIKDNLLEIQKSALRSAELTRQLLAFARKQVVNPRRLNLNDAIAGMLKMLQRLIGEDIQLRWLPGQGLWPVVMDPTQLHQILANLTINARDAMPGAGQLSIETGNQNVDEGYVNTHPEAAPGKYVMLAVSDNGKGMGTEVYSHLFEPFFTTKEVGKGTGLGLATVFGIVQQNQGFINVYSEVGKGTTFRIYFPKAGIGADHESEPPAGERNVPKGTETVLLVEDEAQVLNISRRALLQLGYTVLAAHSPQEAMALVSRNQGPIQLMITDVVMPGMNGRELRMQLETLYPDMRCLFMSGYTADIIAHHGVLDHGIEFLQKPFTIQALAAKIRQVLNGNTATKSSLAAASCG